MKTKQEIIEIAIQTINIEHEAIGKLSEYIDESFAECIELIYNSKGRLIITGIGKSAIIGQKIVATLNSTGTPSVFMHAADAIHGDLGIILPDDIVMCISKSGNTPEIKVLAPLIKNFGNILIAMVSDTDSYLAKNSNYILRATVSKEACPNKLAPTSSTTAQLVIGDALAVCLLDYRSFTHIDFAKYHPGGTLGKKLYLTVGDLYKNNESPKVKPNDGIDKVIMEISSKRLGATAVLTNENKIAGIITDGDLRRMLQSKLSINESIASDIMSTNPRTVESDMLAVNAFELMKTNNITQLLVVENHIYKGMVHLHDILKEGIV